MPQGLGKNLYAELSVGENLHFFGRLFGQGRRERNQRIDRLLKATGLDPFHDRPAGKLSGGMKQKLGLCCALIHDPDLLILDEPTTGVDPLSREQFWSTAVMQASIGASYIQSIANSEINRFVSGTDESTELPVRLVARRAFNPNGDPTWFAAITAIIDQITLLTIVLTGAALIREREHGTIEHLLVMPLTSFDIAVSKVCANGLVILLAVMLSLWLVVEHLLNVPIAGSRLLFLSGIGLYLFFATAMGIFLGTLSGSMAQFALLVLLTVLPLQMLSGAITPIESQPDWLQPITYFFPSRHFVSFSQSIVFRGAGFTDVWQQFVATAALGLACFLASLALFRRSIATSR